MTSSKEEFSFLSYETPSNKKRIPLGTYLDIETKTDAMTSSIVEIESKLPNQNDKNSRVELSNSMKPENKIKSQSQLKTTQLLNDDKNQLSQIAQLQKQVSQLKLELNKKDQINNNHVSFLPSVSVITNGINNNNENDIETQTIKSSNPNRKQIRKGTPKKRTSKPYYRSTPAPLVLKKKDKRNEKNFNENQLTPKDFNVLSNMQTPSTNNTELNKENLCASQLNNKEKENCDVGIPAFDLGNIFDKCKHEDEIIENQTLHEDKENAIGFCFFSPKNKMPRMHSVHRMESVSEGDRDLFAFDWNE